jgi:hypothetical protein
MESLKFHPSQKSHLKLQKINKYALTITFNHLHKGFVTENSPMSAKINSINSKYKALKENLTCKSYRNQ